MLAPTPSAGGTEFRGPVILGGRTDTEPTIAVPGTKVEVSKAERGSFQGVDTLGADSPPVTRPSRGVERRGGAEGIEGRRSIVDPRRRSVLAVVSGHLHVERLKRSSVTTPASSSASGRPIIDDIVEIGAVSGAPGQEVEIPVVIDSPMQIEGIQLVFSYDPERFEPRVGRAGAGDVASPASPVGLRGTFYEFLFNGAERPGCLDALDTNDDGRINVSDPIATLMFLFLGGSPPPEPFEEPGFDPTDDALGCEGGV